MEVTDVEVLVGGYVLQVGRVLQQCLAVSDAKCLAALVVDVATDPNGSVLEMATGDPASIYVVVPVDGKLRIAEGAVYSFYQFTQPVSDRLTDSEWRKRMGISVESYDNYVDYGKAYDHPDWANSYRYFWNYDAYYEDEE